MSTPHNRAKNGEIAKIVLMPGDPLRAKFIAENFLENPELVTDVRNIYGFTGTYKGKAVTVMASGMGMGSMGIYSYELFNEYNVEAIIRIGSAGGYSKRLNLYDVVLAESAWSESSFAKTQNGCLEDVLYPDSDLNDLITISAEKLNIPVIKAPIHSSDVFYREDNGDKYYNILEKYGCECVEMESFALFHNAKVLGKKAACILTISDSFVSGESSDNIERQNAFTNMMKIALKTVEEWK